MLADVAQADGAEQRIGDRVQNDVRVAVALQPRSCGTATPPSVIGPRSCEGVNVEAHAGPRHSRPANHCSARAKSAGASASRVEDRRRRSDLHTGCSKHNVSSVGAVPDQLS